MSEVGNLDVDDVDLTTESVRLRGKGSRDRRVRFGPRTGRALSRYLRARAKHPGADLPNLWLTERGARALSPNGIKIRLKRLGEAADVPGVHAHRWRHALHVGPGSAISRSGSGSTPPSATWSWGPSRDGVRQA